MSDPTQTLSVEIDRDLAEEVAERHKFTSNTTGKLAGILRAALAQPEHQGEEPVSFTCRNWDKLSPESKKAVEQVVQAAAGQLADSPLSEEEQAEYEAARRSIVEARSAQPPTSALSDEDRKQLERIAAVLTRHAENADASGAYGAGIAQQYSADAAFLRTLASQGQGES